MKVYNVFMYTKGTGSGHLVQVNAVYKGFKRANIDVKFYACAYRSKYKHILHPEIELVDRNVLPEDIDIFICDWRSDEYIESIDTSFAKLWIGMRRLGKMKSTFPDRFKVIAIEPNVKGDVLFYPIVSTYPDELKSRDELLKYMKLEDNGKNVVLFAENGAYPKHISKVFDHKSESRITSNDSIIIKSSNNKIAADLITINYYPIAQFFGAVDYLIVGAGYNSAHEAMLYSDMDRTEMINVGGDDQALRLKKYGSWEIKSEPENHLMVKYIIEQFELL